MEQAGAKTEDERNVQNHRPTIYGHLYLYLLCKFKRLSQWR